MPSVQEILEKHSLTISSTLQATNLTTVYLVINPEGRKYVLKFDHNSLKDGKSAVVEKRFLAQVNHEGLKYLDIPHLLSHDDNYMLMEYVEREHWTRDTILERKWSNDDTKLWANGLIEFQNIEIPKDWFSLKKRIIGFMFPVFWLALLLPKCSKTVSARDLPKLIGLAICYVFARFHFRNKVTHYDLQTYNYSFRKDRKKASLLDFELSYYMGDPLYDVLYYVSIPIQRITLWTFQTRLINTYLTENTESGKRLYCRIRLILLVCNINRYLYFKGEADKKSVYQDNIRMLLSDNAFNSWFSKLEIDSNRR